MDGRTRSKEHRALFSERSSNRIPEIQGGHLEEPRYQRRNQHLWSHHADGSQGHGETGVESRAARWDFQLGGSTIEIISTKKRPFGVLTFCPLFGDVGIEGRHFRKSNGGQFPNRVQQQSVDHQVFERSVQRCGQGPRVFRHVLVHFVRQGQQRPNKLRLRELYYGEDFGTKAETTFTSRKKLCFA